MLRHNLLLIFRNFKRFKGTFFINLIGLSTGLACTLLIYLWVKDEVSINRFHKNESRLYQVMENRVQAQGIITAQSTSVPLAETLAEEMPEVEYAVATAGAGDVILTVGGNNIRSGGKYASKDFFKIFSYNLIYGDEGNVLADKSAIVISEPLALKLFENAEDAIGKAVKYQHEDEYYVAGIFEEIPSHSSEKFDFLLSFEAFKELIGDEANWRNTNPNTFVLLKNGSNVQEFNEKIVDLVKLKTENEIGHRTLFATPYAETYLYGKYENGLRAGGRIEYVRLFTLIALVILGLACINFMNLSTAKANRRIKEIGIKKALGARRKTLAYQFISESMLMTVMSVLAALFLVLMVLPQFNVITGKTLSLDLNPNLMVAVLLITLATGLLSGSYPALYLSGFNPINILKGKLSASWGEVWARKGLVVFQFAISVILIVSVLVIFKQIEYVQNKNAGYDRENIIYFSREGKVWEPERLETLLSEIKNVPGIVNASSIAHELKGHRGGTWGVVWEGKDPNDKTEFQRCFVNYGMIETLGMEIAEGRSFSKEYISDSSKIIFNEAAIKLMGITDPVGKKITLWDNEMEILGVVKDFHFESLHLQVRPLFLVAWPDQTYNIMARIEAGKEKETIARLQQVYAAYNPDFPFEYKFLDEEYRSLYVAEERVGTLSRYFAGLAVIISCLGLFGLAAFTAERRIKEIGIRKILGSSELGIIRLLTSEFAKLVLVAIVIALPFSYFLTNNWLENFEFRIGLEWWYFITAGVAALVVACITVGAQAFKAARINPVNSLRNE